MVEQKNFGLASRQSGMGGGAAFRVGRLFPRLGFAR